MGGQQDAWLRIPVDVSDASTFGNILANQLSAFIIIDRYGCCERLARGGEVDGASIADAPRAVVGI
jgi:hypothetical protein